MLEKYVTSLLVSYLSKYVENLDAKKLSIDIWNGKVKLHDLILKPSVVDALLTSSIAQGDDDLPPLPIHMYRGLCKEVSLQIPYKNLRSKPVVIDIGEVLITLQAQVPDSDSDEDDEKGGKGGAARPRASRRSKRERWAQVAKRKARALDAFEAGRRQQLERAAVAGNAGKAKRGFFSRLAELVVNNIILNVQTVHVRYEDVRHRVVAGAILGEVQLLTLDEATGKPTFVDSSLKQRMGKRFVFNAVQIYCDDPKHIIGNEAVQRCWHSRISDWQAWYQAMRKRVRDGCVALSTIFGPVSGSVDLWVAFRQFVSQMLHTPYVTVSVDLQRIMARLTRDQYTTIVCTLSRFSNWAEVVEVLARRPRASVRGHARLWWRYAISTVLQARAASRRAQLLERISEICKPAYSAIYLDVVRKLPLSASQVKAYRFMNCFMTVPHMTACRRSVYGRLAGEIQQKRRDNELKRAETEGVSKKGWLSWLRWDSGSTDAAAAAEDQFLRDLEKDYGIDSTIDTDEGSALDKLPPTYKWLDLGFGIPFVSYHIEMERGESVALCFYHLHGGVRVLNMEKSFMFHFSVQNMTMSNPVSADAGSGLVSHLIEGVTMHKARHRQGSAAKPLAIHFLTATEESNTRQMQFPTLREILQLDSEDHSAASESAVPLLRISCAFHPVEQPLANTHLDLAVRVHLLPLCVVVDLGIVQQIMDFFAILPGVDLSNFVASTREAARAVNGAASQEMRAAIAQAKGAFISMDATAPIIILPTTLRASSRETTIVVSLGRIRYQRKPFSEAEKARRLSGAAANQMESFYYNNKVSLSKFFVELTSLENAVRRPESGMLLIPETSVVADVLQLIDDSITDREQFILRLKVRRLRLRLSLHQVYLLTTLVETLATGWFSAGAKPLPEKACGRGGSGGGGAGAGGVFPQREFFDTSQVAVTSGAPSSGSTRALQRQASHGLSGCDIPLLEEDGSRTAFAAVRSGSPDKGFVSCATDTVPEPPQAPPEDLPKFRVELFVTSLSFDLHEDDTATLQPASAPRFSLFFSRAELIYAMRTAMNKALLVLEEAHIMDHADPDHKILGGSTSLRVDVRLVPEEPTTIGVLIEPALVARLGTPLMELTETMMDIVNLIFSLLEGAVATPRLDNGSAALLHREGKAHGDVVAADLAAGDSAMDDQSIESLRRQRAFLLTHQLRLVQERCAVPERRSANVVMRVRGPSTVQLFNRRRGDAADYLFASASVTELGLFIKKNTVTMEITGTVGSVSASIADCHGLHASNNVILRPTSRMPQGQLEATPSPVSAEKAAGEGSTDAKGGTVVPPHITFSFRKGKPVMPLFEEVGGLRRLVNASELCYSSVVELVLAASTVSVDLYSLLLLKTYFTTGFFSRLLEVGGRPLYNGRTLPPVLEEPRLLMKFRVVARDLVLALLLDPRTSPDAFKASVGDIVVESSLQPAKCQQTVHLSLRELSLWREGVGRIALRNLLPAHTSVDVRMRSSIDLESSEATCIDVRSECISVNINAADLLDGCQLLRQNFSRTTVEDAMSVAMLPLVHQMLPSPVSGPPSVLAKTNAASAAATLGVVLSVCLNKVVLHFADHDCEQDSRFVLHGTGIAFVTSTASGSVNLEWRNLVLMDLRPGASASALLLCDEGVACLSHNISTTRDAVLRQAGLLFTPSPDSPPAPPLAVTLLSVDFTLRRFALSDQWLNVYDFFCNEAVAGAWGAPLPTTAHDLPVPTASDSMAAAAPEGGPGPEMCGSGFHCIVHTPSVTVPFITADRDVLVEATISSLSVNVVKLPEGTGVAARVHGLGMVDCKSKEQLVSWRPATSSSRAGDSFSAGLDRSFPAGDASECVNDMEGGLLVSPRPSIRVGSPNEDNGGGARAGHALEFAMRTDPAACTNSVQMIIGQLNVVCSVPLLYGLVEYMAAPSQPVAKIASLGVMREQRLRVARAAQAMADNTVVQVSVVWHKPRIFLVGDGMNIRERSQDMEVCLGTMRADITLDKRASTLIATISARNFYIPGLLDRSGLTFSYTRRCDAEDVRLVLGRTVGLVNPAEVERIASVFYRNVLLPPTVRYYVEFSTGGGGGETQPPLATGVCGEANAAAAIPSTPALFRTVHFQIDGLLLKVYDTAGTHSYTFTFTRLDLSVTPSGDVSACVPTICGVDHFSNCVFLQSGDCEKDRGAPLEADGSGASGDCPAIVMDISAALRTTRLRLSPMILTIAPRCIGVLTNTLLSIRVPEELRAPPPPPRPAPSHAKDKWKVATPQDGPASSRPLSRFVVDVAGCCMHLLQENREVAVARLMSVTYASESFEDGSSRLRVTLGSFAVKDAYTGQTLYRDLFVSRDHHDAAKGDDRAFVRFSLETLSPEPRSLPAAASPSGGSPCADLRYSKRLECTVESVSFTLVRGVVHVIVSALAEVQQHISEGNRSTARGYVNETAAAAASAMRDEEKEELTEVKVVIHRLWVRVVEHPLSTNCVELCPGRITVTSALLAPGRPPAGAGATAIVVPVVESSSPVGDAASTACFHYWDNGFANWSNRKDDEVLQLQREVFTLTTEGMAVKLLNNNIFRDSCCVNVFYQRALRCTGDAAAVSALSIEISTLVLSFTEAQMCAAMDIVGVFIAGDDSASAANTPAPSPTCKGSSTAIAAAALPPAAAPPKTCFYMKFAIGVLEADMAALFRLHLFSCVAHSEANSDADAVLFFAMRGLVLQHMCGGSGGGSAKDCIDILRLREVVVESKSPPTVIKASCPSVSDERFLNAMMQELHVTVSSTVLFDIREVLYLPFSARVLRASVDPIPALVLEEATTTLKEDLVLDSKHVLRVSHRTRCCYHLDLNKHSLLFTGAPSAQILLPKGCELTLSNGRVVIPGMYALSSYVSFGTASLLLTADDCVVEKRYLRARAGADTTASQRPPATPIATPKMERITRLVCVFHCNDLRFLALAEDVLDLSHSLCMQAHANWMIDTLNGAPVRRNASMQLFKVHFGSFEEHTLLPTDLTANISGVENLSVAVVCGPIEFCFRAILIRMVMEVISDFSAAFGGEIANDFIAPTAKLEDSHFNLLVPAATHGECGNCGYMLATLAVEKGGKGVLCYGCCTGQERLPALDFRVEIPLVDAIVLGSGGELAHFFVRKLLLSIDPNADLQLGFVVTLNSFNNAAAVWEPFVESFDAKVMGNISTQDYHVHVDRLDVVLSPLNIHIFSLMATDCTSTETIRKSLRKRVFRHRKEQMTDSSSPVTETVLFRTEADEGGSEDDSKAMSPFRKCREDATTVTLVIHEDDSRGSSSASQPSFDNFFLHPRPSIIDRMRSGVYARVSIVNLCNGALLVEGQRVNPRGGIISFETAKRAILVKREVLLSSSDQGYLISLFSPLLYLQGCDLLLESVVTITRDEAARRLRRTVQIKVYPLHPSKALISIHNKLGCSLNLGTDYGLLGPGECLFLSPKADLGDSLRVQPAKAPGGEEYDAGITLAGKPAPSLQSVLSGPPTTLCCRSKMYPGCHDIMAYVSVNQEFVRAGLPGFVIVIEERYRVHNKLPYRVVINVVADPKKKVVRLKADPGPFKEVVLEGMSKAELPLSALPLNEATCTLAIWQPDANATDTATNEDFPPMEVFRSAYIAFKNGFVSLTSSRGREMEVQVLISNNIILLLTPFALLNHTSYTLKVRECNPQGEVCLVDKERNYSVLTPRMDASIAACPQKREKEQFFVNLYYQHFTAKSVPFHVQQRGLILLESSPSNTESKSPPKSSKSHRNKSSKSRAGVVAPHDVLHLAYTSQIDMSGAIIVTITPRWVVLNRSCITLYASPSVSGGISAKEAAAGAAAAITAKHASSEKISPVSTPTAHYQEFDTFKEAIYDLAGGSEETQRDLSFAVAIPSQSAVPLYMTPFCPPEVGYRVHLLQSPHGPLYGTPVDIESIHWEVIVAYKPIDAEHQNATVSSRMTQDRFLEISLVMKDSCTYILIDNPSVIPYLVLNRSRYNVVLQDTSPKSKGRIAAQVEAGCGAELILDPTASTKMRVLFSSVNGAYSSATEDVVFDFSRSMSAKEHAAVTSPLHYYISYGEKGQTIIELTNVVSALTLGRTVRALPPTPHSVLFNLNLATLSVVLANRDILFGAITDTRVKWDRGNAKETIQLSIKSFQMDNQTEMAPCYKTCVQALLKNEKAVAVSCYIERDLVFVKDLMRFHEVRLDIVPIALRVSDLFLVYIVKFARQVSDGSASGPKPQSPATNFTASGLMEKYHCPTPQSLFAQAPLSVDFQSTRVLLERFILNPLLLRLWIARDVEEEDFVREEIHTKDAALLSRMLASCEDVNIYTPGLVAMKRSSRLSVLLQWIIKSYMDSLFSQLKGVILQYASSLPFIGIPLKLVSGIGSGAVRLFREPIDGLTTSPKAFAQGLAKGSVGLAQGLVGGGFGAFSNLLDAGSRVLSMGGGTSERQRRQQNLWGSIKSGFKGIVQRPMEGASEGGALGALQGTAQGIFGVLANPISGLLLEAARATGTLTHIINDTYIPKTKRLRPLREFHANGGVARWRSLISVYQYERLSAGSNRWCGEALLAGVDGPKWYPCPREAATFGPTEAIVPPENWILDRYDTNFEGWSFSRKYYGSYTGIQSPGVRTRRKRWVALVRPLPYSSVAFYLGVGVGMEKERRPEKPKRSVNTTAAEAEQDSSPVDFVAPGVLTAYTVKEAKESAGKGYSLQRMITEFFNDGAVEGRGHKHKSFQERTRNWIPKSKRLGSNESKLYSRTCAINDDNDTPLPQLRAEEMQSPHIVAPKEVRGSKGGKSNFLK